MKESQVKHVNEAIRVAKIAIDQAQKALKMKDPVEEAETIRAAWSNLTDAGAWMWRSRFDEDGRSR